MQVDRSRAQNPQVKAEGAAPDKELAPVLDNSIAWGGFVATSTNLRYQTVNAFEERALVCPRSTVYCMPSDSVEFVESLMMSAGVVAFASSCSNSPPLGIYLHAKACCVAGGMD